MTPLIEKGLPAARPQAKTNALEALLLFIELLDKPEPVVEDLVGALSHKQPKIITSTAASLTSVFHNYGCKTLDSKPVLKALPKLFGHTDKNVRTEAQNLTVELYRWLKEAMKPLFWGELKPVQQADLEKLFENIKKEPAPKPERFTRAQQEAMAVAEEQGGEGAGGAGQEEEEEEAEDAGEMDAFDLAEPVDMMPKVPKDLHERLGSTKWKDRKDALDALYAVANTPRIKDNHYDDIVRALAKCMKDANIAVVSVAASVVDVLSQGLRKDFAKYRSTIMAPMMERLKEKKQSVSDALGQALDSVFTATSLSECLTDITEFLKHKNPQVKQEILKFLIRCLRTTRDVPSKAETKTIAEAGTKLLTESSEGTRAGGAEILGTLMKIMGERAMNPYLDGLDDIRKTKIKEFFETAEVKAKDRPKPIVAPPKPAAPPAKKTVVKKVAPGTKKAAPTRAAEPTASAPAPDPEPAPAPAAAAAAPTSSPAKPKAAPSKLGVPKSSGIATPGTGLKQPQQGQQQRKLVGPGGAAPPSIPSPQRRVVSPPTEESAPAAPSQPKFGVGRGLAGRPIAKPKQEPASTSAAPAAAAPDTGAETGPSAPASSGMGAVERAELEELRLEKERLTRATEELRAERTKATSEIHELQNQNAQLIEDHTRDVLSIKAKETQLVRARSDAETAEQTVQKQQREIERLKRELSRSLRATATSSPSTQDEFGLNMGISETAAAAGSGGGGVYQDDANGNISGPPSASRTNAHLSSRLEGGRPGSFASSSPSEEKENNNNGLTSPRLSGGSGIAGSRKIGSPMKSSFAAERGNGSPARRTTAGVSRPSGSGEETKQGVTSPTESDENWKRTAEVTSQLKARIEQMKVCCSSSHSALVDVHVLLTFCVRRGEAFPNRLLIERIISPSNDETNVDARFEWRFYIFN